ncbi:stage III sporulation protein AD [Lachnospiraceae bacterium HCP1S3_A8]|nr:stage III sporulation protein AD [Lachnospiraceae bacterium]
MSVLTIGILGIAGALLAVELKGLKGEYGIYLVAAVGLVIFFYGITKLKTVIETIRQVQNYIRLNRMYLEVLLKMIGITYIAEFSSGICKDAGYGSLGSQIEIFGKLSVLAVSMPILLALLDTVQQFLA